MAVPLIIHLSGNSAFLTSHCLFPLACPPSCPAFSPGFQIWTQLANSLGSVVNCYNHQHIPRNSTNSYLSACWVLIHQFIHSFTEC